MGSKKKAKTQVSDYKMSLHVGVARRVDSVRRIRVSEKTIMQGNVPANTTIDVNEFKLFGGSKKEGGVRGRIHFLMGADDQVLAPELSGRLSSDPSVVPGFRGITSLFFTGGGPERFPGFNWVSNAGYLRPVDVTVRRAPVGLPGHSMIPRPGANPEPIVTEGVLASVAAVYNPTTGEDYGLDPTNMGTPGWTTKYGQTWARGIGGVVYNDDNTTRYDYTSPGDQFFVGSVVEGPVVIEVPFDYRWILYTFAQDQGSPFTVSRRIEWLDSGGNVLCLFHLDTKVPWETGGNAALSAYAAYGKPGALTEFFHTGLGDLTFERFRRGTLSCELVGGSTVIRFTSQFGPPGDFTIPIDVQSIAKMRITMERVRAGANYGAPGALESWCGAYVEVTGWAEILEDLPDANPAHIIYECLTNNDWGLGLPAEQIDGTAFYNAGETLWAEQLGLSLAWVQQSTVETVINDVLGHIDGVYGIDPTTGKIYIKLIRDDYDLADLFELTEDNCRIIKFQRKALAETVNEVTVTWTDPLNEQESTVTVHDIANYSMQGQLVSSSVNYYGVRSSTLALRLAERELRKGSVPLAAFDIEVSRVGWNFKPGDVLKLTYPEYGINELPIRLLTVNYGRPGDMKIVVTATEDVFSMPANSYVDAPGTAMSPVSDLPVPLNLIQTGTVPYYLLAREIGSAEAVAIPYGDVYAMILAAQTVGAAGSFDLLAPVVDTVGQVTYETQEYLSISGYSTLSSGLSPEVTSVLSLGSTYGAPLPYVGALLWIGGNGPDSELALVTADSPLTVKRGVLDTVPRSWPVGTPVWVIPDEGDISDDLERVTGLTLTYKLLTRTGDAVLSEYLAPSATVTLDDRPFRPYRPANVTINGVLWPNAFSGTAALTVAWAARNRLTEDPLVRAWNEAATTAEAGTTYTLRIRGELGGIVRTVSGLSASTWTYDLDTEKADSGLVIGTTGSATASRSNMGAAISGSTLWSGFGKAADGKLYGAPLSATSILIIDPVGGTATTSSMGGVSLVDANKWLGAITGPDGKIYGVPYDATSILIIDPVAGTASRSAMGADLTGSAKWADAVLGADGKIYCVPHTANDILIIDTVAGTATRTNMGLTMSGTTKWVGGVRGDDNKIYCVPHSSNLVLIIDPAAGTATTSAMGATISGSTKWSGAAKAPDGKIYCVPYSATSVLIINPATGTATTSTLGASLTGSNKWASAVLGIDSLIYCVPRDAADFLVIDPAAGTASRAALGATLTGAVKFRSSVLADNGWIYAAPYTSSDILRVQPPGVINRPNGLLTVELESVRDGLTSYQKFTHTTRRSGYGFNYGMFYGGT